MVKKSDTFRGLQFTRYPISLFVLMLMIIGVAVGVYLINSPKKLTSNKAEDLGAPGTGAVTIVLRAATGDTTVNVYSEREDDDFPNDPVRSATVALNIDAYFFNLKFGNYLFSVDSTYRSVCSSLSEADKKKTWYDNYPLKKILPINKAGPTTITFTGDQKRCDQPPANNSTLKVKLEIPTHLLPVFKTKTTSVSVRPLKDGTKSTNSNKNWSASFSGLKPLTRYKISALPLQAEDFRCETQLKFNPVTLTIPVKGIIEYTLPSRDICGT